MPKHFKNQNYKTIKKQCLAKGILFEDPEFQASNKSLFFSKVDGAIEWRRPKELCKAPRLLVDGATCNDLVNGEIKSVWFITACTALAHEPKLWNKVFPDVKSQEYDDKNPYAGIFRFQFWRFGEWIEVVIDDRLPTKDGQLIFLHSKDRNEFWSALFEKAYAKLFGDYESMSTGHPSDALVDFTGGLSEKLDLKTQYNFTNPEVKKSVFQKLEAAIDNKALINCINMVDPGEIGTEGPKGLIRGQGYNITLVKTIEIPKSHWGTLDHEVMLLRLFNPWGEKEWTGAWSDNSKELKQMSQNEWEKVGIKFTKEGEFYMSYNDFLANFTHVDICHFVNTSFFSLKKTWHESVFFGEWKISGRNGGNNLQSPSFFCNPQYLFDVTAEDTIMVTLDQRDVTSSGVAVKDNKNCIGFYILKTDENRTYRIHVEGQVMFTSQFLKARNVFGTVKLPKGRFVLVPCCDTPAAAGEFMVRFYTSHKAGSRELTFDAPVAGCCSGKFKIMTTIVIEKLEELALPANEKGTVDPHVVVKCEDQKVTSESKVNQTSPEFNLSCTFYRKKPSQPIIVEVYCKRTVRSIFLGEARVDWPAYSRTATEGMEKGEKKEYPLYARDTKDKKNVTMPGKLFIFIQSSDDFQML
ncbi:calpain-5-like isoform X2 [Physella acuta]|uniref:calpain-5-like isoform X2 n=1 Tax=Physella acuta TaxID=109671 RepID=UPI0027DD8B35|nr:calpain-5-like isoform X2 [Physella acuta]